MFRLTESGKTKQKNIKTSYLRQENIESRKYQLDIAEKCTSKNSLVVLPTGLGKTIIGVYVAALTLEKFPPKSKILVLAPTRPLINQPIPGRSCHYPSFSIRDGRRCYNTFTWYL